MKCREVGKDKTNEEKVGTPVLRRTQKAHEIGRSLRLNAVSLEHFEKNGTFMNRSKGRGFVGIHRSF